MNRIVLPPGALYIIDKLSSIGFHAYVVGGCVRDSVMGKSPKDWDICTSATPTEILECFPDERVLKTGLQHGTVTVILADGQYEVTTFRIDGKYSDNRHPDKVEFVADLDKDLSRRDFTFNAMAYNTQVGLIDYFCGVEDLDNGILRCVGNPDERFHEDALRILRALRFASMLGFEIDVETEVSIHKNAELIDSISKERIYSELCKILKGKNSLEVLIKFSDVISVIIPEIKPCIGFVQNNKYHRYTVYDHIIHAVSNYEGDDVSINVALLLHDIGKPLCYSEDENGGHFYGHAVPSRDIAETVINRLRVDNKTKCEILELVLYHDTVIEPTPKVVRRWLNKIGEKRLSQLLEVRMADIKAHSEGTQQSRIDRCESIKKIMQQIIEEQQCFSIKDLAINGKDLLALGAPEGKIIGDTLTHVLDLIINAEIENDVDEQLMAAKQYLSGRRDEWLGKNDIP